MISPAVKRSDCQGMTLIEVLVAGLIGTIAIGLISTALISAQRQIAQQSKRLLLSQNLSSVMQLISEDVQKAGYDGVSPSSLHLSGAADIVSIETAPALLGYIYRVSSSATQAYRTVVFKHEVGSANMGHLKICEKPVSSPLTLQSAAISGSRYKCFDLFDPKQVSITDFSVSQASVASSSARSAMLQYRLSAQLVNDPSVIEQQSATLITGNWQ
ncbi:PilW family protein [Vibrio sp.]|uniref:PilW family protein n=1 Tax=Vibrio sp. TaxID=678 RepID=UPI003D0A045F